MGGSPSRSVTFVVDPSMYGPAYAPPREVYGDLDKVVRTDLYYHYATPICAQRWIDVCEDPAYGHGALLDAVRSVMPSVVAALRAEAPGRSRVHLCSLGPGDGSVDLAMLRGLDGALTPASYAGLDFSFELLRRSVNRIAHAPGLPEGLRMKAVCGDFTDLGAVTLDPAGPEDVRLFALTGFTLGNYPEDALLGNIRSLMAPGDFLFMDARLHGLGPLSDDLAAAGARLGEARSSYDVASVRRFVLGPLEVATTAEDGSLAVHLELGRGATAVPNALNLVIYCTGLDAFMRLSGERVRRDRVDLAVTTSYNHDDLADWLAGSGFAVPWSARVGDTAFFLLRR